jgi:uncharacterized protein YbbK (DUF523 family)
MKKILVSMCLFGDRIVRYDGEDIPLLDPVFLRWKEEGRLVPVCPEVFGGLPVPRPGAQRSENGVFTEEGADVTQAYLAGAKEALRLALANDVCFCIMKSGSPSCGSKMIYDGTFSGNKVVGQGLAAELLRNAGFTVFDETDMDEAAAMSAVFGFEF